jgi:hypothetical protein
LWYNCEHAHLYEVIREDRRRVAAVPPVQVVQLEVVAVRVELVVARRDPARVRVRVRVRVHVRASAREFVRMPARE